MSRELAKTRKKAPPRPKKTHARNGSLRKKREEQLAAALAAAGDELVIPEIADYEGREKMRESKFLEEYGELVGVETRRADVACIAEERFGPDARPALEERLSKLEQAAPLIELISVAIRCRSLAELEHEIDARIATAGRSRKARRSRGPS